MNLRGVARFFIILLILGFTGVAAAAEIADKPTAEQLAVTGEASEVLPLVPNSGVPAAGDESAKKGRAAVSSLPDSGASTGFTYSRSSEDASVYEVYPEGRNDFIPVSESYLRSVVNNTRLTDSQRLQAIDSFPAITANTYRNVLGAAYPDASTSYPEPFPTRVFETESGAHFTLSQDDLAEPYVRVSIAYADGSTKEFSVNREIVAKLLADSNLTGADLLQALEKVPFPLPEEARKNFRNLTKDQLLALVRSHPDVARQELVKMMDIYRRLEAGEYKGNRGAMNRSGTGGAVPEPRGADLIKPPLAVMPGAAASKAEEASTPAGHSPIVSSLSSEDEGFLPVYGWALLIVVLPVVGWWAARRRGFIPRR